MNRYTLNLFLFLVSFFIFFTSGVIDSQDGFQYLAVARNIYYLGKPTAPVYEYDKELNVHMSTYVGKDGNTYSPTGLGYSLAMLPAVALTDLVYKFYHLNPSVHFPLENDWLILLLASFTNSFFGATLGVTLFLYFKELGLNHKQALFMSLVSMIATNLWVYTKNSFAHIMFTAFLILAFFFIKKYSRTRQKHFLIYSGVTFGLTAITYNPTFLLAIPSLILYWILLFKPKINTHLIKKELRKAFLFFLGLLPFIVIFIWFEKTRAAKVEERATASFYTSYASYLISKLPVTVFFEGIFGQLLSPGRSIFLYSPILIIPILFWHKIKSKLLPEVVLFITLSIIYIVFYSMQFGYGKPDQGIAGFWHGETSWGPRYLIPLIPFGMLVIGHIYQGLTWKAKLFFFYPLIMIGLYLNLLGILMPYQIKYHDLQGRFYVNQTEYTTFTYTNLLPRYSPVIMMSKKLIKLAKTFPQTLNHGLYDVRFYDGIDFPFDVGPERWRAIEKDGYIYFNNSDKNAVSKLSFGLINHPISESSASANLQFTLNNKPLLNKPTVLKISERSFVEIPIDKQLVKDKNNQLIIKVDFEKQEKPVDQILGLISFHINNQLINFEALDFPYYPNPAVAVGTTYIIYGGQIKNSWKFWEIHTQIYERTPDFWWMKALYYWDYPKKLFLVLFIINLLSLIYFGKKVLTESHQ